MTLMDNVLAFAMGCIFGGVLGYIVGTVRSIKEELEEVDDMVRHQKDDSGFVRFPILMDIAMFTVVAVTVWAAFTSQVAVNQTRLSQEHQRSYSICTKNNLQDTIRALNERTEFTQYQLNVNVERVKKQEEFLELVIKSPNTTTHQESEALEDYVRTIHGFIRVTEERNRKIKQYPYPSNNDLDRCIERKVEDE